MRILIFLTYGQSLLDWEKQGILERELKLYHAYQDSGHRVGFCSFGSLRDLAVAEALGFDSVLVNRWGLPTFLYARLLPTLYANQLKLVDCLKTNQLWGAHVALRVANKFGKPLIVRQGFSHYEFTVASRGRNACGTIRARAYEKKCLRRADGCIVTTEQMAEGIHERVEIPARRVKIIPNFIIEEVWDPPHKPRVLTGVRPIIAYAGRISSQKNLLSVIRAAAQLNSEVLLIGDGEGLDSLKEEAQKLNVPATFLPRLSQREVARHIRESDVFVLPSFYEGHPKILIEAMAIGIPVVATTCQGSQDVVRNGVTGVLSSPSVDGIQKALSDVISMSVEKRQRLGDAARRYSREQFSLRNIARKEMQFIEQCLGH